MNTELQFISVQHLSDRPRAAEGYTSSLLVRADCLEVIGVLPHCTRLRFNAAARAQLRAWLDAQEGQP